MLAAVYGSFIYRLKSATISTLSKVLDVGELPKILKEQHIVSDLCDLLHIHQSSATASYPVKNEVGCAYLSCPDKLRGVFLQTLKGTFAVESALTASGVDLTIEIVASVLNRGNLSGSCIVSFFNWAVKQPNIPKICQTYNVILKALGRRRFFHFMEDILWQMKKEDIKPTLETLAVVLHNLIRAGQVKKAMQFFDRLDDFGFLLDVDSLNVLLHCLCRRGHVAAAASLLKRLKEQISVNSTTYNIILGGWAKVGNVSKLKRNLQAMKADGLEYNSLTFSHLIEGLGRAGLIDDAVALIHRMDSMGCNPDIVVYNTLIRAFIAIGNVDQCMSCYKTLCQRNCQPNADTYISLISTLVKVRRVADAFELFEDMVGRRILPSAGPLTSVIVALCSFGPPYAAMELYRKAKRLGCKMSPKFYKALMKRLSRFGKCGMIVKLWEEMLADGYSSDVEIYEHVIDSFCNIGQLNNGVLLMEEAIRNGYCPSKIIYNKLNNKLLSAGKVEEAYKLFLKIKGARLMENARKHWLASGWHF